MIRRLNHAARWIFICSIFPLSLWNLEGQGPLDAARVGHIVGKWGIQGQSDTLQFTQLLKEGSVITYRGGDDPGSGETPIIVVLNLAGKELDRRACAQWKPCPASPIVIPFRNNTKLIPGSETVQSLFASAMNALSRHPEHTVVTISKGKGCGQPPADGIAFMEQDHLNLASVLQTNLIPNDDNASATLHLKPVPFLSSKESEMTLSSTSQWKGRVDRGLYELSCGSGGDATWSWVLILSDAGTAAEKNADLGRFASAFAFWRDQKTDADYRQLIRGFLLDAFDGGSSH